MKKVGLFFTHDADHALAMVARDEKGRFKAVRAQTELQAQAL